ncbi:avidin-like [Struthio camelus]|uniref:avidin-like n=1 Tax=Struthio camelus TaxID=8801 RepID=UPI0036041AA9
MDRLSIALILALVAASVSAAAKAKCVLTGSWINELGSNMTISSMSKNGNFSGLYYTAVTATKEKIKVSPLQGSQHHKNEQNQPTFGFTVNWSFSDSTTVFTGQCFVDKDGKEILRTTWLLRQEVHNLRDDWKATSIGSNVFTRFQ